MGQKRACVSSCHCLQTLVKMPSGLNLGSQNPFRARPLQPEYRQLLNEGSLASDRNYLHGNSLLGGLHGHTAA